MTGASEKYASVTKDMTKEAIIAALGPPQKEEGSTLTWEVRYSMRNYASLIVEFDRTGHPIKTTKSDSRWSSSFVGGAGHSDSVVK